MLHLSCNAMSIHLWMDVFILRSSPLCRVHNVRQKLVKKQRAVLPGVDFHEKSKPGFRLKVKTFVSNVWIILIQPIDSDFMDFTKGLSLSFG